ncbi:MAG: ribosome maturation factor RimP [Actinomycetota bacterium]
MTDLDDRVRELAAAACAANACECLEVEVKRGRTNLVRVTVDSDAGVDLDRCAEVSNQLSRMLDADDLIPFSYTLEVTTPGADRPLKAPREFARNIGRPLRIVTQTDSKPTEGKLVSVREDEVTLEIDGDEVAVPLAKIEDARVVFPW